MFLFQLLLLYLSPLLEGFPILPNPTSYLDGELLPREIKLRLVKEKEVGGNKFYNITFL